MVAEAGAEKRHLIFCQVLLANMDDFQAMNDVYYNWIDPNSGPTRACYEARLASPDYLVEIVSIAAI